MPGEDLNGQGGEGVPLLGSDAAEAKFKAARRAGLFCSSCGEPMDGEGWEYVSFRTELQGSQPTVLTARAYICGRDACADAREQLERTSAARRPWAPWHIFYSEEPAPVDEAEAPPPAEGS